ncbi:MAG: metallopeptidase TldD-related protein [Treponema sp.]|nr:metallopeptidase TldD-related protein [Treponema sp.]
MTKEKMKEIQASSTVKIEENKITAFDKTTCISTSFRIHKDGICGIYYHQGNMSDEEGFAKAEKNLELQRPYPFELETGKRSRDKTEKLLTDEELMATAKKSLKYLTKKYPDYTFSGQVATGTFEEWMENSKGMDYYCKDGNNNISIEFKHKDSKDISDGYISYSVRKLSLRKFYKIADNILTNFTKEVPMPEECIIIDKVYGYTGLLNQSLNVERLKNGTSLLTGKVGEKVFSDLLTISHDVSDKNTWMSSFWDGDGVVPKGDKVTFIKNGKILRGYCGKKIAKLYKVKTTGNEGFSYTDIPGGSFNSFTLKTGKKSAKEILNGKLAIIPIQSSGGGFKEKGEYTMPVQIGLLTDGEKILGRVPPFTISTNMFDMFGKDFLGVSKYNAEIFNDKVIMFKCEAGKI